MTDTPTPDQSVIDTADYLLRVYRDHIQSPNRIPNALSQMGFRETYRFAYGGSLNLSVVAVALDDGLINLAYVVDLDGAVTTVCALFQDSFAAHSTLTDYVARQPNAVDISRDVIPFMTDLPAPLARCLVDGSFSSSKSAGETALHLGVHPFPVLRPDGSQSLALSVERNLGFMDQMPKDETDAFFAPASKFQRYMEIFTKIGVAHGDDLGAVVKAAQDQGFDAQTGDTDGAWMGGNRDDLPITERTLYIQLNVQAATDFELGLFFRLDPHPGAEQIRSACFKQLGITQTNDAGHGLITIRGEPYGVDLIAENEMFGNYILVLYK